MSTAEKNQQAKANLAKVQALLLRAQECLNGQNMNEGTSVSLLLGEAHGLILQVDALLVQNKLAPPREGMICVDKNKRGQFEVWEPGGCKNGHAAGFGRFPTLEAGIAEAERRVAPMRTRVVRQKNSAKVYYL